MQQASSTIQRDAKVIQNHTVAEKESNSDVQRTVTCGEGDMNDLTTQEGNGLRKSFTNRQIHIISLGSNIGSGVFISTGAALRSAGPGNMILGYGIICTLVTAMLHTIAEMTISFPVSGNFINYTDRFIDPAMAFAVGFAEWLGWTAVTAAEAIFFNTLVNYWADGAVHQAGWITIFLIIVTVIFFLPNTYFAWFEYVTSVIKIFAFLIVVLVSIVILAGAGPSGHEFDSQNYHSGNAFKNGFLGFSTCALYGLWAAGDQVFTGIMAGEAHNPRLAMAHATKTVPVRVTFVYMTTVLLISFMVPMNDDSLFGGSGTIASPYVIGMRLAGVKGVPHFLNVVIIIGISAVAAESIYIASRILRTMSAQNFLPKIVGHVDSKGRPTTSLLITIVVAYSMAYINLSNTGVEIFTWLVGITSSSFFMVWITIAICSLRFRAAVRAQKDELLRQPNAYRTTWWPIPPGWLLIGSTLLLICCLYSGVSGGVKPSVYSFFQYNLGIILIASAGLGYKLIFRTKLRNLHEIDLATGRAWLNETQTKELEEYRAKPRFRRFLTYIKLW